jgi:hypothetical protein
MMSKLRRVVTMICSGSSMSPHAAHVQKMVVPQAGCHPLACDHWQVVVGCLWATLVQELHQHWQRLELLNLCHPCRQLQTWTTKLMMHHYGFEL